MLLNSFTWSKAKDNGAGSLENPNGNFPAPQDFYNLDADYGTSGYDQPLQQHDQRRVGAAVRPGPTAGCRTPARSSRRCVGGWKVGGISTMTSGEGGQRFMYTPAAPFQVSGIQQDFRGANNYRPNVVGDPYGDRELGDDLPESRHGDRLPTDPSQPFGNAPRNSVRGPWFWQVDLVAAKDFRLPVGDRHARPVPARGVQPAQPRRTSARPTATAAPARLRHHHARPTTRGSCSSGFKVTF